MKQWLAASLFILMTFVLAVHSGSAFSHVNFEEDIFGEDDVLPWPWGTECPFPWGNIEGVWKASKPSIVEESSERRYFGGVPVRFFYEFKVTDMAAYESKLVQITKYDEEGQVIGTGRGYSHPHQKIVRAVIVAAQGVNMANHRVIIRAYKQKLTLSCGNELVTVLTTRGMDNEKSSDRHYVLKKIPSDL